MRIARVGTPDGTVTGSYEEGVVSDGDATYPVGGDVELLAPSEPSACYCVGRNYAGTIDQYGYDRPERPSFFIKPPTAVCGHGDPVPYPSFSDEVTYAGELAAVIGTRCRDIEPGDVDSVVLGYTILNDIDALDQPGLTERKAFDASAPVGPWIETDLDPLDLRMRTRINGEVRQRAETGDMLFTPREVITFLAGRLTLTPGDIVSFGSPPNPGVIAVGDDIEVWYEGIGTLENTVTGG